MLLGDVLEERFQLELQAGSGGMGRVFRGLDRLSGARVAVKVMLERRSAWDQRFAREAETLASLQHPNIVRHIAHGMSRRGERYLVMEWLEGEDLAARLTRGALSVHETLLLARQVAAGLSLAHARGVVHRDLKPSNLWLVDGKLTHVKVLDFGVARLSAGSSVSHAGSVVGTPGYMAPEQVRGGDDVDARADVFSLGAVLCECLTGKPLFWADHVIGMLAKILLDEVPSLRELDASIPAPVDRLLLTMLAKSRLTRPMHGAAVLEALRTLEVTPTDPAPSRTPPRATALSASERRTLSLVLVGNGVPSSGETPNFEDATPGISEEQVRRIVTAHGGVVELLADGTAIVTFAQTDSNAMDQAARAARCALALAPICLLRPISVVTGRAELSFGTPLGRAIDRAAAALARLEARPSGGPIAIDELTSQLLDARFELLETPQGLELESERALPCTARRLLGKATACVGRDLELGSLESTLRACREDSTARAVVVSAAAGMGKSRLAVEFVQRAALEHPACAVWSGRGDPLLPGAAFAMLGDALRSVFELRESDSTELSCARIRAGLTEAAPCFEPKRVATFLGELVGAPFPDGECVQLRTARRDPQLMNAQMLQAWLDFVLLRTGSGPVLLVLEDLHWGDLPSVRFIDAALRELSERPFMVLALARPEVHERFPRLWSERGVQHVHLRALSPQASARLVRQGLGEASDRTRVERVVALAEGNAFYLEELTRAVVESPTAAASALPATVLAMVEVRLDKLDDDARRVLRAASVFGASFWEGGVLELLGAPWSALALQACLGRLVECELLVLRDESRFVGEREFSFRHALLREGAYARLTEQDRQLGHRVVAHWLERHGESNAAALALHMERGGEAASAGRYYLAAANTALSGADFDAVLSHARRGVSCGVAPDVAVALHGLISVVHGFRNQYEEAAAHMDEVRRLSPADNPLRLAHELLPILVRTLQSRTVPDVSELLRTVDEAVAVGPTLQTLDMFGSVVGWAHFELDLMGLYELTKPRIARFAQAMRKLEPAETTAAGWRNVVAAYRSTLCMDEPLCGLRHAEDALAAFQLAGHPARELARVFIGVNAQALGAYEEAYEALDACRHADVGTVSSLRDFLRVLSLLDARELPRALRDALETVERNRARNPAEQGRAHWALSLVYLRIGDFAEGERELATALSSMGRWPAEQLAVMLTRASLLLALGRQDEARLSVDEATRRLSVLASSGYAGPLLRFAPLRRAEVYAALGKTSEAQAELRVAHHRLLSVASSIEDATYRASFLEREPHSISILRLAKSWSST
ncbi:MAG: hypothetical protein JWN04_4349 [Myxococcaceae bacterium]|nr:hypothetical protein [Myxococcaceae bacterium]